MGIDKSLNQSPQGGLEKIGYTSSNGSPGNFCKVLNEHTIRHVLVGQNGGSTHYKLNSINITKKKWNEDYIQVNIHILVLNY